MHLSGIYKMGFESPSKIQAIALPTLLGDPSSRLNLFSKYNYLNNFLF